MSTATTIPETWELTGDDAKDTLARVGRKRLIVDALKRLRFSDGFSHARSMAFLGILLFVEAVIGAVGISRALGNARFAKAIADSLQSVVPGPAGRILHVAAGQGHQAAASGQWLADRFRDDRRPGHGHHVDGPDRTGAEPPLRYRDGPELGAEVHPRLPACVERGHAGRAGARRTWARAACSRPRSASAGHTRRGASCAGRWASCCSSRRSP